MLISDVNDDLIDEDKLNEIKADEPEPAVEKEKEVPQTNQEEGAGEETTTSADL